MRLHRLLIVEDERAVLESLLDSVDWARYDIARIETASDAEEAIEEAIRIEPDIAILDVCIGGDRGYDLVAELNVLHLNTQYILIGKYARFEDARKAIRCGAKDFLLKPVERGELRAAIERIVPETYPAAPPGPGREQGREDPVLQLGCDSLSGPTRKLLQIIQAESGRPLTLKAIAEKFKMNSTYLGQLFLKETHLKFSEYLMLYRLRSAREQIEHTDEKISYIAYAVGFSNLNYFYMKFREYYHRSPTDLRRKWTDEGPAARFPTALRALQTPNEPDKNTI